MVGGGCVSNMNFSAAINEFFNQVRLALQWIDRVALRGPRFFARNHLFPFITRTGKVTIDNQNISFTLCPIVFKDFEFIHSDNLSQLKIKYVEQRDREVALFAVKVGFSKF